MSRLNNVLNFPSGQGSGNAFKVFAVIFYAFVAFMLTFGGSDSEGGLTVLVVLGLMYQFFVRQRIQRTGYFQKNKVMLIILLVIFILAFKLMVLLFLGLAGVYWLLIARSGKEPPYFLRFHMLTALILNFFILMPYLLLAALIQLIQAILLPLALSVFTLPLAMVSHALPMVFLVLVGGAAIWLSISVLMGRTPYIPVVTDNVRHWA